MKPIVVHDLDLCEVLRVRAVGVVVGNAGRVADRVVPGRRSACTLVETVSCLMEEDGA